MKEKEFKNNSSFEVNSVAISTQTDLPLPPVHSLAFPNLLPVPNKEVVSVSSFGSADPAVSEYEEIVPQKFQSGGRRPPLPQNPAAPRRKVKKEKSVSPSTKDTLDLLREQEIELFDKEKKNSKVKKDILKSKVRVAQQSVTDPPSDVLISTKNFKAVHNNSKEVKSNLSKQQNPVISPHVQYDDALFELLDEMG